MAQPTLQEFFDKTIQHLIDQKERAFGPNPKFNAMKSEGRGIDGNGEAREICLYRTSEGKRCAAGVHIPDEHYNQKMEGKGIFALFREFPSITDYFPEGLSPIAMTMIRDLQLMHDEVRNWTSEGFSGFKQARAICAKANLKWNFPQEVE